MIYKKLIDIASFSPRLLPHPSAWLGFLPFAGWLIREISPRIFVELGTHYGHSYFSFCQAVSDFNCSTKCYAVDTWHGDEHAGEYDDEVYSFVLDHQKKYYESFSTLLRMYFDEAAETFSHSSIDLLHIDGLHTYEAVRHDFEKWLPKLSPGAVVLFHDTNVRERNFGVWRFWEELQTYYPNNLSFMHSSGLGVLQLNNAPKEKIINWLRPDFQEKLQLVQYFTALGQRQLERYALEEIAQQLNFVKKSLGDRESRVHELNLAVADRDAQMHQLNTSLEQRDTLVHQLNQVISDREAKIEHLNRTAEQLNQVISDREAKIDHLNRTLVARAEEVNGLRRVVETRAREMAALVEAQRAKADVEFQHAGGVAKKIFLQTASAFRSRRRGEREQLKNLRNALSRQPLLDPKWYLDQYPDVRLLSMDPIQHYVTEGARERKNPNPYFFTTWYLQEYPDVAAAGLNPLLHYLEHGVSERRNPNPYFHITWYLETYPEAVTSGMDPLLHYLRQEKNSRTDPHPLFHAHWYLEQYPEVAQNDMEPLLHYVLFGWREGKNPNPYFFTNWYVQRYPWAVDRCGNPFLHFLQFAVEEKTSPNPYIDTAWYLQTYPESAEYTGGPLAHYLHNAPAGRVNPNPYLETDWYLQAYPDVAANGLEPLLHYILYGAVENRNPGPHFDTAWYWKLTQGLGVDGMNPLLHYIQQGEKMGIDPNPYFDGQWYLQQYPDAAESSMSPFRHFLEIGLKEGRRPHPDYDAFTYQSAYAKWLHRFFLLDDQDREIIHHHINKFKSPPLLSVVMPVYNPPPEYLDQAIQSVRNQLYPHWELCIADDASTDPEIVRVLHRHCTEDARIKVMYRGENGHISNCSNSALEMVSGEYIALLDHDDLLAEDALFWVADAILRHPDAGLIYSDEDKIDDFGHRLDPYFKSDWNPFLFLGHNMVSHLGVYRSSLVRHLGGFRVGYEGSQDYDLAARVVEQLSESQVVHIPRILYHWRILQGSTAASLGEKPYAQTASERAVNEHLQRLGLAGRVELNTALGGMHRVRWELPDPPPLVSLIIPTRNGKDLVRQCIESILAKTTYPNYEILLVDNGSDDPEALGYFRELVESETVRLLRDDGPFNFSRLNNGAVEIAGGEVLVFLNNDTEVMAPDWLSEMVALTLVPQVGAVGAKLLYPDGTIQHGGVVMGVGGCASHMHWRLPAQAPGYFGRAHLLQAYTAVTAACLAVRKSVFVEAGGFDEERFKVGYNDVDFCLKVRKKGYWNVWTPWAELIHHESISRGTEDTSEKKQRFWNELSLLKKAWPNAFYSDTAYNPNLTLDKTDFTFSDQPRLALAVRSQPSALPKSLVPPADKKIHLLLAVNREEQARPGRMLTMAESLVRQGIIGSYVAADQQGVFQHSSEAPGWINSICVDGDCADFRWFKRGVCAQLPYLIDWATPPSGVLPGGGWLTEEMYQSLVHATVVAGNSADLLQWIESIAHLDLSSCGHVVPDAVDCAATFFPAEKPRGIIWRLDSLAILPSNIDEVLQAVNEFAIRHQLPVYCEGVLTGSLLGKLQTHVLLTQSENGSLYPRLFERGPLLGIVPVRIEEENRSPAFLLTDGRMAEFGGFGFAGVYSANPAYRDSDLRTGWVVENTADQWLTALQELYGGGYREEMEKGKRVREVRSIERLAKECWLPLLNRIALADPVSASTILSRETGF